MKVGAALAEAARRLAGLGDTPRLDAELLMAKALGVERESLLLNDLDGEAPEAFDELVERRAGGEPVAYITGRRAFWTIELMVGPGALVPRPDSETLIEAAVEHFGTAGPQTILDLGTGPGTLLLAALDQWPAARGLGIDRSPEALAFAQANARHLGLEGRAAFRLGNWAEGVDDVFDLILCNPPYVASGAPLPRDVAEWEPREALFAGGQGLNEYRRLAPVIGGLLRAGGITCLEIGAGQEPAVRALFMRQGLNVGHRNDLAGHVRCLTVSY